MTAVQVPLLTEPLLLRHASPCRRLLRFDVIGKPAGWARARAGRRGGKTIIFSDPRTEDGEERVRRAVLAGWRSSPDVIEGAVGVEIVCFFARPGRLKRKADRGSSSIPYTGKPDPDNIAKLILDGITRSGAWRDDTQVADLVVVRRYLPLTEVGAEIGVPRMEVRVWAL